MELEIEKNYETRRTNFYLREKRGNRVCLIGFDGENLVEQVLPPYPEPIEFKIVPLFSLELHSHLEQEILQAFMKAASDMNIRTEHENTIKGKLEATQSHLADLREISFKLLKINQQP